MKSTNRQQFMTRQEVTTIARQTVQEYGGQVRAAEALGVRQPSISKALKPEDTSMDDLRRRILEELGGYSVDAEVYFRVEPPKRKK